MSGEEKSCVTTVAGGIEVRPIGPADLPDLITLCRAVAQETRSHDSRAADRGEAEVRASLAAWDFLRAAGVWVWLAWADGVPAGYALAVRVPKTDARVGFLFLDELYVLAPYRRRGVGRALVRAVQEQARAAGLAGVRLLVRQQNRAARRLYRGAGFSLQETGFGQWLVDET